MSAYQCGSWIGCTLVSTRLWSGASIAASTGRIWRRLRGVGDLELLAIEGGTWEPPLRVAVALALALDVDADDLVPWPQDDGDGAERD